MSGPVASAPSSLKKSVALVWRTLRSMRTAIVLLLMLAAAAVVGSLIPQIPNSPQRVAAYQLAHPLWAKLWQAAGFFDVFGSWWFALLTTLLFVSLVACLIPRSRALIRAAVERRYTLPATPAFPMANTDAEEGRTAAAPRVCSRSSARCLRSRDSGRRSAGGEQAAALERTP